MKNRKTDSNTEFESGIAFFFKKEGYWRTFEQVLEAF